MEIQYHDFKKVGEAAVERLRKMFPAGTRLRCQRMDEPFPGHRVPNGTEGTVTFVDDEGKIHMRWDNGMTLPLLPDEDDFEVVIREDKLREAMLAAGYALNTLESTDDNLRFHGPYGSLMTMSSWDECEEWLNGVVFDDPEQSDRVERILHPERFCESAEPVERSLDLQLRFDPQANTVEVSILDDRSGFSKTIEKPYSPDDHSEFDAEIGAELYEWFALMKGESDNDG